MNGYYFINTSIQTYYREQQLMKKEMLLEDTILELYAGLAREAARCELYVLRAMKDERRELIPLFKSLAMSFTMQANRFMIQIRGRVYGTDETVEQVYRTILPGSIDEYEQLARQAKQLGSKALATGFDHAARVQRKNGALLRQAEQDQRPADYYVCDFCGFVCRDTAPEKCPICTAPKRRFKRISAQ